MKRFYVGAVAIGALALGVIGVLRPGTAQEKISLASMSGDSAQWVMPSLNYANTRNSTLNEITTENVKNMKVAWSMSTGATRGHEGQPLVVGDTMYFESAYPNHVFAVDLNDYHTKWEYTPKQDPFAVSVACCDLVNRGVAYGDGKVIVDALDGQVIALDAASGKVVWNAKNSDPEAGQTLTAAPLVVKDKVIVGVSGGEYGVRGYLTAYNLSTGKKSWRAYSEGPDKDILIGQEFTGPKGQGTASWHGDQWKVGGGTTWRLVFVRSRSQSGVLRHGQPRDMEPVATSRRQQVVDDDLRAQSRYRDGEMGLPDDAARRVGLRRR